MESEPIRVLLISEDRAVTSLVQDQFTKINSAEPALMAYHLSLADKQELAQLATLIESNPERADQPFELALLDLCSEEFGSDPDLALDAFLAASFMLPVVAICENELQIAAQQRTGRLHQFLLKEQIQSYLLEQVLQSAITSKDSAELLGSKNRAEDDLHSTTHMLRALIQSSQMGIVAIDRQKKITLWNPAAEKIFGWKAEEVVGGPLVYVPDALKARLDLEIDKEFNGTPRGVFEAVRQKKDGSLVTIRASGAPLYNANHEIIGSMGIFSDLTEYKAAEKVIHRQSEELSVLNSVALKASQSLDLRELLPMVCESITRIPGFQRVMIWLIDENTTEIKLEACAGVTADELAQILSWDVSSSATGQVIRTGQPILGDYSHDSHIPPKFSAAANTWHDYAALPIRVNETILGTINLASHEQGVITRDNLEVLETFASQIGVAIQNARLFEQVSTLLEQVQAAQDRLQALSRRLVDVQELERRRIARELHDEIGQILTGLKLLLKLSSQLPLEQSRENLKEAEILLSDLIIKVRNMSLELRPAMLDDLGLLPALLWHFDRFKAQTQVAVHFEHSGMKERRFSPEIETAAYRIIQEALTNAARYAGVGAVDVSILTNTVYMKVDIVDRGSGFNYGDALKSNQGNGLSGMRERAVLLKGSFSVETIPGKGTHLTAYLPLEIAAGGERK